MHNGDQVAQRRDGVELPRVASSRETSRAETLLGGRGRTGTSPGRVAVAYDAESRNGPEEHVADFPEDGPLVTQEPGAFFVRRGGGVRKTDEEGGDAHEGLGYCVACE